MSYRLHAFFGLHIFAIMALIFLSGSTLMFVWELESTYTKSIQLDQPASASTATFGQRYDNIKAYDPNLKPAYFWRSGDVWIGDNAFARDADNQEVYVWSHPESAEILGVSSANSLRKVVHDFHLTVMTGHRLGALISSGFSFILLFFIVTGFITYHQFWKGFLRLPSRKSGPRMWWGGVHRLFALWLSPFFIILALTGIYFFIVTLGIGATSPPKGQPVAARTEIIPVGFDGADLDRAITLAQTAMPELDIVLVDLPFSKSHAIVVYGWTDAKLVTHRANRVMVDPVTFDILGQFRAENLPMGRKVQELNLSLHTGVWGGLFSRILWLILGLIATFFCFAGMMIYASKAALGADTKPASIPSRVWHGMSVLKWVVVAYGAIVIGLFVFRFML